MILLSNNFVSKTRGNSQLHIGLSINENDNNSFKLCRCIICSAMHRVREHIMQKKIIIVYFHLFCFCMPVSPCDLAASVPTNDGAISTTIVIVNQPAAAPPPHSPIMSSWRLAVSFLCFLLMLEMLLLRVNLGMALVCMLKQKVPPAAAGNTRRNRSANFASENCTTNDVPPSKALADDEGLNVSDAGFDGTETATAATGAAMYGMPPLERAGKPTIKWGSNMTTTKTPHQQTFKVIALL